MRIVGVDIGGTQTRCAIAKKDQPQEICWRISRPTPQEGPDSVLDMVISLIREGLDPNDRLCTIGCVAPGMTDTQNGIILEASNLNGWIDVPLRTALEQRIGIPTVVENDVNAAVLAEATLSFSSRKSPVVYMTVSTGIAAGILIDGKILHGANYSAGEIGGMIPSPEYLGQVWQPGGCTELHAGGTGLAAQWARTQGGPPDSKRAVEVFNAADVGNPTAKKLIRTATNYITQAAVALSCVIDPEVIILGGSIGRARSEIIEHMRQELANSVPYPPSVVLSFLEDDAPLLGALVLADFLAGTLTEGSSGS